MNKIPSHQNSRDRFQTCPCFFALPILNCACYLFIIGYALPSIITSVKKN